MSYRTLLSFVEDGPRADACSDYAARLAHRFDSRLLGLSCHRLSALPGEGGVTFLDGDPLTVELRVAEEAAVARETRFLQRCRAAGVASFDAVREEAAPLAAICDRALAADLVVMGQPEPEGPRHVERRALFEAVLAQCARPVLALPYAGTFEPGAKSVFVAWDDSPGAARAASAALPLLQGAEVVHLVGLRRPKEDGQALQAGLDRAQDWLSAHGVPVRARLSVNELPAGEALLCELADDGAGLLVMGAWGRRRMMERLLGGATRSVVEAMSVPVLFAH